MLDYELLAANHAIYKWMIEGYPYFRKSPYRWRFIAGKIIHH